MLPAAARVRSPAEHRLVSRRGRRARRGSVVVAVLPAVDDGAADDAAPAVVSRGAGVSRAGVVVGRTVGGAVVRSRVKRRLREVLRSRLPLMPAGSLVVVRGLPGADVPYGQLDAWVGAALQALTDRPRAARSPGGGSRS